MIRGILKRDAAVSSRVFMPALKMLAGIAEQKRTRCHQLAAIGGTVLEASRRNHRNRYPRVLFFERTILWTGGTDDIFYQPAIALCQPARCWVAGAAIYGTFR
jgi:hypothetical protein